MELLFYLLISLAAILVSCLIFTNSIEWFGVKLNLSHGITGSILAAVGTALPETVVPLVAIFWGVNLNSFKNILSGNFSSLNAMDQISIGAIIGAPFMLCTVAFFLIGLSSLIYFKVGVRTSININMDESFLTRDLRFFILSFFLAFTAIFLSRPFRIILACVLILLYFIYIYRTFKMEKDVETKIKDLEEGLEPLLLTKILPFLKPTLFLISLQLIASLLCLIYSAHHFVDVIKEISHHLNFPAFVISLLLTPLATELPEKFNSWLWISQKKDILAVGNISGALVFQSTFPISVGLLFTSWHVTSPLSYLLFAFCILNSALILFALSKGKLTYKTFLLCGVLYLFYLLLIFLTYL